MQCFRCGIHHDCPVKFCSECGTQNRKQCTPCNTLFLLKNKFCTSCGLPLPEALPPPTPIEPENPLKRSATTASRSSQPPPPPPPPQPKQRGPRPTRTYPPPPPTTTATPPSAASSTTAALPFTTVSSPTTTAAPTTTSPSTTTTSSTTAAPSTASSNIAAAPSTTSSSTAAPTITLPTATTTTMAAPTITLPTTAAPTIMSPTTAAPPSTTLPTTTASSTTAPPSTTASTTTAPLPSTTASTTTAAASTTTNATFHHSQPVLDSLSNRQASTETGLLRLLDLLSQLEFPCASQDQSNTCVATMTREEIKTHGVTNLDSNLHTAVGMINELFDGHKEEIDKLAEEEFWNLAQAVASALMLAGWTLFSVKNRENNFVSFLCPWRKVNNAPPRVVERVATQKTKVKSKAKKVTVAKLRIPKQQPSEPCKAAVLVSRSSTAKSFVEVKQDHCGACFVQMPKRVEANENFVKGSLSSAVIDQLVRVLMRSKEVNPSLARKHLINELDRAMQENHQRPIPTFIKNDLLKRCERAEADVETNAELNRASKFIAMCEERGFPHKVYMNGENVEAIFWVDWRLIVDKDYLPNVNMVVCDSSFGVVKLVSGMEKFQMMVTCESDGRSQPLVCGFSVSDHSKYFNVMWDLFDEVFGKLITPEVLIIVSDEDRAFLKSCRESLTKRCKYQNLICIWHKCRNVRKGRGRGGGSRGDEFPDDGDNDVVDGEGDVDGESDVADGQDEEAAAATAVDEE